VASSVANLIYKPLVLEPGVLILVGSFQQIHFEVFQELSTVERLMDFQGLSFAVSVDLKSYK
jgi:hypothetical protein